MYSMMIGVKPDLIPIDNLPNPSSGGHGGGYLTKPMVDA